MSNDFTPGGSYIPSSPVTYNPVSIANTPQWWNESYTTTINTYAATAPKEKEMTPIEKARAKRAEAKAERLLDAYEKHWLMTSDLEVDTLISWVGKVGRVAFVKADDDKWRAMNGGQMTTKQVVDYLIGEEIEPTEIVIVEF